MTKRASNVRNGWESISSSLGGSEPPDFNTQDPIQPDSANRWLRWMVYLAAVLGLGFAAMVLWRPSDPSKTLQARPGSCSPYCR
jgi:hypothetical protein